VVEDFHEIKALGANTVRIHLQVAKFVISPDEVNKVSLMQLKRLVNLAEQTGLYLNITGLGCYHKQDVPAWYDAMDETARWETQAMFWKAVAEVCANSPAIFCYDLMNEPILADSKKNDGEKTKNDWLGAGLGDKFFVQRITLDLAGRSNEEVAKAWIEKLTTAIRSQDKRHMITVGVIPWAHVWPKAKPLFYNKEVSASLDLLLGICFLSEVIEGAFMG
jgi:aryl-phospho-beta-D-glucosidase BglC (GH1 family)